MMACFDQKSCMNYHSPQDTNTQTTMVARLCDRDIDKIWKFRVICLTKISDMGVDNIKWIRIFYVIVQHISDDYV